MKLINRDTDYTIRAICFMAQNRERIVSVSELVRRLKVPLPFLRKALQILNKKGVLSSFKGQDGGFRLSCLPHQIFVMDLIEIFQGPFKLNKCVFKKKICPDVKKCPLKKEIDVIERDVALRLKSITIASLLNKKNINTL